MGWEGEHKRRRGCWLKTEKKGEGGGHSAKGWKPPGGLSQGEIPLHYEDTGAQDLSHILVARTAALLDVHEKKHKMMHSEDIPVLYVTEPLMDFTLSNPEPNKLKHWFLCHTKVLIWFHSEWKGLKYSRIWLPELSLKDLRKAFM